MKDEKREVYLMGIGTGTWEGLTVEASELLKTCDLFFGARRMLAVLGSREAVMVETYHAEEIEDYLRNHEEWKQACVLLSGDVGFYSGAAKLLKTLKNFKVTLVPGVSSMTAFCARMKISWEELAFGSLHGRNMNLIAKICRERYTFALFSGEKGLKEFCRKLIYYDMTEVVLHVGANLGYPEECIFHGTAEEILNCHTGDLVVIIAENHSPDGRICPEIPDEEFIRGKVPMTKREVRTLGIQKLGLKKKSVLYDIGAGTGAVSVQAAVDYPDCEVYAVEQTEEAIALIEQNKRKFAADNLTIVYGKAPEALTDIPVPTHAFIGGSAGNLEAILSVLWEKNPKTVVVITVITLETMAAVVQIIRKFGIQNEEILQISTAHARKAGEYHLMMAQNPVTLIWMAP